MKVSDIDWKNWEPEELSTIMFVVEENRVLLIHKKRGLGAGKINGPGGKIEKGETPMQCAIRETNEELHINPLNVRPAASSSFTRICQEFMVLFSSQPATRGPQQKR